MYSIRSTLSLIVPVAAGLLTPTPIRAADDAAFFRKNVAPVFETRCLRCHNAETRRGRLSLETRGEALAGGKKGPAVVPGNSAESLLYRMISGDDPKMPKRDGPLADRQVTDIRKWIEGGALWPEEIELQPREAEPWWSLKPIERPNVPKSEPGPDMNSDWVRTPIDAFVLARLHEKKLAPSPEADKRTLIRRLYFNLHGLPPTPEDVERFLADDAPDAYRNLVDRLLASPRYGERWARHWLDVAHYGDTHGYDKDKRRDHAWPYRDYVIDAFNRDKPYGRFAREQIAGDVLDPDDPRAIVATGFIASGPWDFVGHVELAEGTVEKDKTRSLDRDDMVSSTMATFISMTVHCARCHEHKFDPITQEDYYALQAVFAGVERADRPYDPDPRVHQTRARLLGEKEDLEDQRKAIQQEIARRMSPETEPIKGRIESLRAELAALPKLGTDRKSETLGYHSAIMPAQDETKWVQVDLGRPVPIQQVLLIPAHVAYGGHKGPGFGFPVRFRVDVSNDATFGSFETVADHTKSDFVNPGDEPVAIESTGRPARYVRVTATKLWQRTDDWIFALGELVVLSDGRNVAAGRTVTALDTIDHGRWHRRYLVDELGSRGPLTASDDGYGALARRAELGREINRLTAEHDRKTAALIAPATRERRDAVASRLTRIDQELASLPEPGLVYAAANAFKRQGNFTAPDGPRPVHVLHRGSVTNPGKEMGPGALECVDGLEARFKIDDPTDEGARRRALADWIAHPDNPLTWRSIVNRVWHYHFGRGLVDTPNDFGRNGSKPTHPDLLDWLAAEFRDSGGSIKALHRLILNSSVYRQSSASREDFARLDAGNQFLWRMNRARLDAESIRDAVLAVSGKLDLTMGGPGFDLFEFEDDHSPRYLYVPMDKPEVFRRTVYRFSVRSVRNPFLETLDCSDPNANVPVRSETITALQALALYNDAFVVRQARYAAERIRQLANEPDEQIALAFRLILGRPPAPDQRDKLVAHAKEHGLANVCRLLVNANEFIFVD